MGGNRDTENTMRKTKLPVRPVVSLAQAQSSVERSYGISVTRIEELVTYDDRGYHIHIANNHTNPNIKEVLPHGYVFKILNNGTYDKHVGM